MHTEKHTLNAEKPTDHTTIKCPKFGSFETKPATSYTTRERGLAVVKQNGKKRGFTLLS